MIRGALALLALAAVALVVSEDASAEAVPAAEPQADPIADPDPNAGTWLSGLTGWLPDFPAIFSSDTPPDMTANRAAFLAMIRRSETGTTGAAAYSILVGGGTFSDFSKHPKIRVWIERYGIYSTAAGAYQINWPTWSTEQPSPKLPDFSPASQDAFALHLLRKSGALALIDAGDFAGAVRRAAPRWASLPGAGYGQSEQSLAFLQSVYTQNGGALA